MAKPAAQSFDLAVGQAKTLVITMQTAPDSSVAADTMRFRLRRPGGAVLVEKETGTGVTCTDGLLGVWEVAITAADTAALKPGLPIWAFWNVTTGEESPVAIGTAEVYLTAETDPS